MKISKSSPQKECNPLKSKTLQELKPFINGDGLVCVGGRLQKSSLDLEYKHPIILPKNSCISLLIVRDCHKRVAHGGRGATLQEIRNSGIWIINCNGLVRHIIYNCVKCRSMREDMVNKSKLTFRRTELRKLRLHLLWC